MIHIMARVFPRCRRATSASGANTSAVALLRTGAKPEALCTCHGSCPLVPATYGMKFRKRRGVRRHCQVWCWQVVSLPA
jgi:hypothetical protein